MDLNSRSKKIYKISQCIHKITRLKCPICSIKSRCLCGNIKNLCKKCTGNEMCLHNVKRGRCSFCRFKGHTLCILDDYQTGENKDEICFCRNCIIKYQDPQNLNCIFCRKYKKVFTPFLI